MLNKCEIFVLIVTLTFLSVVTEQSTKKIGQKVTQVDDIDYRLPTDIKPVSYKIKLTPNIVVDNFTFTGDIEIEFFVEKKTKNVTFHIDEITINNKTIRIVDKKNKDVDLNFTKTSEDTVRQFYTIEMEEELKAEGTYVLSMPYEGILNNQLFGFYRSSYKNDKGQIV